MTRIYQTWPVRDTGDGNIEECLPKDANNWAVYWREGGEGPATWLVDAHNEWLADDLVEALNNLEPANVPQPIQPTLNSKGTACFSPAQTWLPIDEATPVGVKIQLINENANVAQYGSLTGKPGFLDALGATTSLGCKDFIGGAYESREVDGAQVLPTPDPKSRPADESLTLD